MADRTGLRLLGLVFFGVTTAVMLMAGAVVYAHVGGRMALDQTPETTATTATVTRSAIH